MIAVKRMENPPTVDTDAIPSNLTERLAALDLPLRIALAIIGEGAKRTGIWVGVSIRDIAVILRFDSNKELTLAHRVEEGLHLLYQPDDWFSLFSRSEVTAIAFRSAEGKWVTIDAGFAYPTQKAIEFMCQPTPM